MALDFGKLNFSVSFNPTSAFPLDARSYFESYADAVAAAAKAVPAGSTDAVYYYGQTLVVVENSKASFYIIQPNNTLSGIEGASGDSSITVNENLFEYDVEGNLSLKGFDTAALGSVFSVGPGGTLVWASVYTKTETDAKIGEAVAAAAHLKRKIVESKDDIDVNTADADQYIYMVPTGLTDDSNKYYEYMVLIVTDSEGTETRFVEQVGSWDVDLSGYATTAQLIALQQEVNKKVDAVEGSRLMTEEEGQKLASLEESLIKSVDGTHFEVSNEGKLSLLDIPISKVTNLDNILNKGQASPGGYYLITADDKAKLKALVINGEDGSLEISGTVNAENVQGLDTWITEHSTGENYIVGLSENNLTDERLAKLEAAITEQFIESVNEEFTVTDKKLSLNSIAISKVTNLDSILNNKVESSQFVALAARVTANEEDIALLQEYLTWGELT